MTRILGWWPLSGRVAPAAPALSWTAGAVLLVGANVLTGRSLAG